MEFNKILDCTFEERNWYDRTRIWNNIYMYRSTWVEKGIADKIYKFKNRNMTEVRNGKILNENTQTTKNKQKP